VRGGVRLEPEFRTAVLRRCRASAMNGHEYGTGPLSPGVIRVVSADGDPMPVLTDDPLELIRILG
jgi:hypothetical protein